MTLDAGPRPEHSFLQAKQCDIVFRPGRDQSIQLVRGFLADLPHRLSGPVRLGQWRTINETGKEFGSHDTFAPPLLARSSIMPTNSASCLVRWEIFLSCSIVQNWPS